MQNKNNIKGFTLVELLIVLTVVGTLAAAAVFIINPEELLKQTRDATRVNDLGNINRAISIFLSQSISGDLNGTANDGDCINRHYTNIQPAGYVNSFSAGRALPQIDSDRKPDGTGWIPIDFTQTLVGVSPLSVLPIDSENTGELVYRYACNMTNGVREYELNAKLESIKYTSDTQFDRDGKDGGDKADFYEIGSALNL